MPHSRPCSVRMRAFYETSDAYFEMLAKDSSATQARDLALYVSVMKCHIGTKRAVLDLGCGRGITTEALSEKGRMVVGVDLSWRLLQGRPGVRKETQWVVASAEHLPFQDQMFGVVGMNSVREHVADVPLVLRELARVAAPGGRIVIVSPNLLTPLRPLKALLGRDEVSINFYGSRSQAFFAIFANLLRVLRKRLTVNSTPIYREPDLKHFSGPDDDATWYCNSVDVIRSLRKHGLKARRVPLPLEAKSLSGRVKGRISFFVPDLDKGFCVVADKT